jgi:hypothetical protein
VFQGVNSLAIPARRDSPSGREARRVEGLKSSRAERVGKGRSAFQGLKSPGNGRSPSGRSGEEFKGMKGLRVQRLKGLRDLKYKI